MFLPTRSVQTNCFLCPSTSKSANLMLQSYRSDGVEVMRSEGLKVELQLPEWL